MQDNIPCTLITDSMAAALMAAGGVKAVVAGSDRVANNGDTANKIGTYSLAVLAKHHGYSVLQISNQMNDNYFLGFLFILGCPCPH